MSFDRWGMSGAIAALRDPAEDGMNIMHRLCDRPDWIAPFPWRAHAEVRAAREAAGLSERSRKVDTSAKS